MEVCCNRISVSNHDTFFLKAIIRRIHLPFVFMSSAAIILIRRGIENNKEYRGILVWSRFDGGRVTMIRARARVAIQC